MAAGDLLFLSGATVPNKVAFVCGKDDSYFSIDNFTATRVAADDATGTFTAWVMLDATLASGTYTIIGNGDDNVVEFLDISIETGLLTVRCTDNTVAQFVTQADGDYLLPYTWYHIAVVQAADGFGPKLYINGKQIAATNDTATDVNEWYVNLDGMDKGLIGASNKSGNGTITQELLGFIGEVKYWNSALTSEQVKMEYEGNSCGVATTAHFLDMTTPAYTTPSAYAFNAEGDAVLTTDGNSFTCMLKYPLGNAAPVVADDITIGFEEGRGHAVIVKAA